MKAGIALILAMMLDGGAGLPSSAAHPVRQAGPDPQLCQQGNDAITLSIKKKARAEENGAVEDSAIRQEVDQQEANGYSQEVTQGLSQLQALRCPPYPKPLDSHGYLLAAAQCAAKAAAIGANAPGPSCNLQDWAYTPH